MEERPLFGAGSTASKHTRNRTGFLRPAPTADGRLHPVDASQDNVKIPSAVVGTKAMRQNQPDAPTPVPDAIPAQTVSTTAPDQALPTVAPVQDVAAQVVVAPAQVAAAAEPQVQAVPVEAVPVEAVPVQTVPVQTVPVQTVPVQTVPMQTVPMQTVQEPEVQAHPMPTPDPAQPAPDLVAAAPVAPVQIYQPEAQTGSEEDRQEMRKRALKGGMIVLPGQMMSSYACKIRNESSGGVMLALTEALMVPGEFYLIREADPGHKIPCRVAWREHDRLGAEFIAALSAP